MCSHYHELFREASKRSTMASSLKFSLAMALVCGLAAAGETAERVQAESLTIGAAYSLKPAFHEILPMFEREYGTTIQVLLGPSQTLRQHIEKGTAIDVFLPAAAEEVEKTGTEGTDSQWRTSDLCPDLSRARHVHGVPSDTDLVRRCAGRSSDPHGARQSRNHGLRRNYGSVTYETQSHL
ncbi:MAG: modA [Nitrospira sp.]|nr:modA [Nitrospira sp.]